jgi:excinuclease UvrABC ATPase subunit
MPKGRCETCEGEGFVFVEPLFLPSVYAPCPTCHGARYNEKTLEIKYRDKNIAEVLRMTVDEAWAFFADELQVHRALRTAPLQLIVKQELKADQQLSGVLAARERPEGSRRFVE